MKRALNYLFGLITTALLCAPVWADCFAPGTDITNSIVPISGDTGNLASGVVVSKGYVLTAAHVIAEANNITAKIQGIDHLAYLIFSDDVSDLALLKVNTGTLEPMLVAKTDPQRNAPVWAIGYPLGGALAANAGQYQGQFSRGLKTTADVKSGQSGGALIGCHGDRHVVYGVIRGFGAYQTASGIEPIEGFSIAVSPDDIWALFNDFRQANPSKRNR